MVYKPNKQELSNAIKTDIIAMLVRSEAIGVFELRRIEQITRICIDLLNSIDTPHEGTTFVQILKRIEDICPTVNVLLANSVFDGEAALEEARRVLVRGFSDTFQQEMKVLGEQREQLQRDREQFVLEMQNAREMLEQHKLLEMKRLGALPTGGQGARSALTPGEGGRAFHVLAMPADASPGENDANNDDNTEG